MPFYCFKREDDGKVVEKKFSISECPSFIVCEDGVKAIKIFTPSHVSMFDANGTARDASKLNADMRAKNKAAGSRMKDNWQSYKQ